jgi:hypothetical protein
MERGHMKRLLTLFINMILVFGLASAAYGKSYELVFSQSLKAGKVQLNAGRYWLTVQGDTATFKDSKGKSYSTPIKLEKSTATFRSTFLDAVGEDLKYLQLGGTSMTVVFVE